MNYLPQSRREMGRRLAHAIDAEATRVRHAFDPERGAERTKEYMVKGRAKGNGVEWDVFELRATGAPLLVMGGFSFQEEAILCARDRLLGKVAVSFHGVRGVFSRGASLALPVADMSMPFAKGERVYTRPAAGGGLVVSAQPPKPKGQP